MLSGWTMVFTIVWQQLCGVQNRLFWGGSQPSKVAHARWGGVPGMKWRRFSPTFGVRGVIRAFLGDRRFPGQEEVNGFPPSGTLFPFMSQVLSKV